jgi:hypothetical protein
MHQRRCSVVGYAWNSRRQQSSPSGIDNPALAMRPEIADRAQAQAWPRAAGDPPGVLLLRSPTRLGRQPASTKIAFDDQTKGKRFCHRIETVTVASMFERLPRAGLAESPRRLVLRASRLRPITSGPGAGFIPRRVSLLGPFAIAGAAP